jgi:Fe2+ or Zn2+ uptake regulation protein
MRNTKARQLIIKLLEGIHNPISAKEIVKHVSENRPEINKSTVYRFIKALTDEQQLITIQVPGRGAVYELSSKEPHYHFTCDSCETVVCMGREGSQIKKLVPRGYSISPNQLVLSGKCPSCKDD